MRRTVSFEKEQKPLAWQSVGRNYEGDICDIMSTELEEIEKWLSPSQIEEKTRLLTITKYSNLIEYYYPSAVVITQGSSATETYLPTSDIDFIISKLPHDSDPVKTLRNITKLLWKQKIIVQGFIIPGARVPIIKCVDRTYGYRIDICSSNVNGALNIPRVKAVLRYYSRFRSVFMFLKLFMFLHDLDDPATGGFGSNHLFNIFIFAIQAFPNVKNTGELLVRLFDVLANKINFFLCGISTAGKGRLFPKRLTEQLEYQCPQAFVFEDPQMHNIFFGNRTHKTLQFRAECKKALAHILSFEGKEIPITSIIGSFLPDVHEITNRRNAILRIGNLLERPVYEFSRIVDDASSRTWNEREKNKATGRNGIIQVFPDADVKPIPRSASSPNGWNKPQNQKTKNIWQKKSHSEKKKKEASPPVYREMKKSTSAQKLHKFRK